MSTVSSLLKFDQILKHASQYTLSDMGKSELNLSKPYSIQKELEEALLRTKELSDAIQSKNKPPLEYYPDTRNSYKRLSMESSWLSAKEFLMIAQALKTASLLKRYFYTNQESYPALNRLLKNIWIEKTMQANIAYCIDRTGEIQTHASESLSYIRSTLSEQRDALKRKYLSLEKRYYKENMLMEKGIAIKNGRYVLAFRVEHKYEVHGFIHGFSHTGRTVFIEPSETLSLQNEIRYLEIEEEKEIMKVLKKLSLEARNKISYLLKNQTILSIFDAIYAKSKLAIFMNASVPTIKSTPLIKIKQGVHPLLLLKQEPHQKPVPINISIDTTKPCLIISGPNAGGKSIALKTVGLLSYMVQCGFLVPCQEESSFFMFDHIFVSIGDSQSIKKNLSTFSAHLKELNHVLENATSKSIVLIDEICANTSPEESTSLAASIIEELADRKSFTIITTHQSTLKAFAENTEGIQNGSMQFDKKTLTPTYEFIAGIPGASFALEMAQRIGLPSNIIKKAHKFHEKRHHILENFIIELSDKHKEIDTIKQNISNCLAELKSSIKTYKTKIESAENERRKAMVQALSEKKKLYAEAKQSVSLLLEETNKKRNDIAYIKKTALSLSSLHKETSKLESEFFVPETGSEDIKVGDIVRLANSKSIGKVREIKKNIVTLTSGNISLKTELGKIIKVRDHKNTKKIRGADCS